MVKVERPEWAGGMLTLRFEAYRDAPFTLQIEPWGATYELAPPEFMYVDLEPDGDAPVELVHWPGGISVMSPERARTRDSSGKVIDEF